ncbi:hypothetical protein MAR_013627 [Mya arenaria]|uniref:Uncharacterized protein n=1 Tax=Mya arenaria TaxID=6604 RepID=A0ABY7G451_MYAAR|nr:hypothetical protein MAR_013627 [Mya arenaria]
MAGCHFNHWGRKTTDKRLRGQGRAIGRGEYSKRRSIDQIVQCEVTDRLLDGLASSASTTLSLSTCFSNASSRETMV